MIYFDCAIDNLTFKKANCNTNLLGNEPTGIELIDTSLTAPSDESMSGTNDYLYAGE